MARALDSISWETALIAPRTDRALESYVRKKAGLPSPSARYFTSAPWLVRAMIDLRADLGLLMHVEPDLSDLMALIVSQENSCRFCIAAMRAMLWMQGMSEARIRRVEQDLSRADLPPRALAAIAFARSQSRGAPLDGQAARAALFAAGLTEAEMREIAFITASVDFINRVHTIAAVPTVTFERMPQQLHMRLMRPLVNRIMQSHRTRGEAKPLDGTPSHPYANVVTTLAGSPIAPALGKVLGEMWASSHLTRRCKLLMMAVIARGLGCPACAPDLAAKLAAEGCDAATLGHVLTHLDAPALDDAERLLVRFARETIWYEPAALQRQARALRDRLSEAQFVEALGVAALANGLCRMGVMVLDG